MIIFSHRGIGFDLPESNLESFKEVLKGGFSLEIDVQKTKDNKIVVIHDSNIRIGNIDKRLSEISYEEAIKSGVADFFDTLETFLLYGNENSILAIHIKDDSQEKILELVADGIVKNDLLKKCFIFDLTIEGFKKIKSYNPLIKTGFSIGEKRFTKTIYLWEDVKDYDFEIVWWDEWYGDLYTPKNYDQIKKSGKIVYAIAQDMHHINNHPLSKNEKIKEGWQKLMEIGVEGICTDYPKELLSYME